MMKLNELTLLKAVCAFFP